MKIVLGDTCKGALGYEKLNLKCTKNFFKPHNPSFNEQSLRIISSYVAQTING